MTNIIGPHGAGVNETYTRPTDTASGSGSDSWFKDCVGGVAGTGTKIPAVWLNKVTAQIREAIRGMGVTEAELDDEMLLKAIQTADRAIVALGAAGQSLYAGLDGSGQHQVRKLKAGANITLSQLAGGEVEIVAATGSGGNPLANIGGVVEIYKGLNAGTAELRSLEGLGGIAVTVHAGGNKIQVDGSGLSAAPAFLFEDRKTAGTHGGTFTSGSRQRRELNTPVRNVGTYFNLSGNQMIAQVAGTYWIEFDAPAYGVTNHQAFLRNTTTAADVIVGASHRSPPTGDSVDICSGAGAVTVAVNDVLELQHICSFTQANYGFGYGGNLGPYELYSVVKGWKI